MHFGSYQIVRKIATGGMAEIFLARHLSTEGFKRQVVIKRILPELSDNPSFVESFLDEARLAGQLNHPNVVQIYDLGKVGAAYFIAMEYIRGVDLVALLARARRVKEHLPLEVALRVFCHMCAGLDYAHQARDIDGNPLGVVHRDVTPSNVLVSFDGPAKLVDFGIAKATASGDGKTKTGTIKGKFAYLAPEQILGESIDKRVDVFAAGIVLFELLTSRNPFRRDTEYRTLHAIVNDPIPPPGTLRATLPPEFDAIVAKALARDPNQRYQSAGELLAAVEGVARSADIGMGHAAVHAFLEQHAEEFRRSEEDTSSAGVVFDAGSGEMSASSGGPVDVTVNENAQELVVDDPPKKNTWLMGTGLLAVVAVAGITWAALRARPAVAPRNDNALLVVNAIEIKTDPAGASVLVNGTLLTGATPMRIEDVEIGKSYAIELVKAGSKKFTTKVDATAGVKSIEVPLAEEAKAVARHVPAVVSGGAVEKEKPKQEAPSGPGKLRLLVKPWASVKINGKSVGDTPFAPLELQSGTYEIVVDNPDINKHATRKVKVEAGKEALVQIDLAKD